MGEAEESEAALVVAPWFDDEQTIVFPALLLPFVNVVVVVATVAVVLFVERGDSS